MNNRSKYFFTIVATALLLVVGWRYYEYVLHRNFWLEVNAPCDVATEKCFVVECDTEAGVECDDSPYKKIEIKANKAPQCLEEHTCDFFSCSGLQDCTATYCSSATLAEGEICAE